ncbi:MAG TPA: hypothetical protein VNP73_01470 [Actinomycetota bacterium]|nr:hypothetical protein [Actinomycetota bacterium]
MVWLLTAAVLSTSLIAVPARGTGLTSDNVTYLKTVPLEAGVATGARIVGKHLYVAGAKSFSIYDISDPENPALLSYTPIGAAFAVEDVDTNGKILLIHDEQGASRVEGGKLSIWDVENKSAPAKIAEVTGVNSHTFSCVLKCSYAYGSRGHIIDLRKPEEPKLVGSWGGLQPNDGFDVTEVAPGLILTASRVMYFLDARKDPANPTILAKGSTHDNRLIHSNRWPNAGRDRFYLVQGETPLSQTCDEASGAFMTWDASKWRRTHSFSMIDEFRVGNGTYTDGNPPAGAWGCTTMWFDDHPNFNNGGLVVSGFFEHGARFLKVDTRGKISEIGYFTPAAGETIATYWVTEDIVYAIDLHRGIDILRFAS